MKDEVYVVDLVSHQTAKVERAQCKCVAAVNIICCVTCSSFPFIAFLQVVSMFQQYLIGLKGHQFMSPSQHETSDASDNEDDQQPLPVTSFLCQWKQPTMRKSNLRIGEVQFKKHQFGPQKRKRDSIEDFDLRPIHLHNTAPTSLSTFLTSEILSQDLESLS